MPAQLHRELPQIDYAAIQTASYGYTYVNTTLSAIWTKKSKKTWVRLKLLNGERSKHTLAELLESGESNGVELYRTPNHINYRHVLTPAQEPNGTVVVDKSNNVVVKAHNGKWFDIFTGATLTHKTVKDGEFFAIAVIG